MNDDNKNFLFNYYIVLFTLKGDHIRCVHHQRPSNFVLPQHLFTLLELNNNSNTNLSLQYTNIFITKILAHNNNII